MRHLVIGQGQKAPNFSAFHWSPHGCLITIGQHFVTTRVVHLPKRTETSLITESDQSSANHQLLQLCAVLTACPIRTRLCGPCLAAKAGSNMVFFIYHTLFFLPQHHTKPAGFVFETCIRFTKIGTLSFWKAIFYFLGTR